jgi:hypothetical protein
MHTRFRYADGQVSDSSICHRSGASVGHGKNSDGIKIGAERSSARDNFKAIRFVQESIRENNAFPSFFFLFVMVPNADVSDLIWFRFFPKRARALLANPSLFYL